MSNFFHVATWHSKTAVCLGIAILAAETNAQLLPKTNANPLYRSSVGQLGWQKAKPRENHMKGLNDFKKQSRVNSMGAGHFFKGSGGFDNLEKRDVSMPNEGLRPAFEVGRAGESATYKVLRQRKAREIAEKKKPHILTSYDSARLSEEAKSDGGLTEVVPKFGSGTWTTFASFDNRFSVDISSDKHKKIAKRLPHSRANLGRFDILDPANPILLNSPADTPNAKFKKTIDGPDTLVGLPAPTGINKLGFLGDRTAAEFHKTASLQFGQSRNFKGSRKLNSDDVTQVRLATPDQRFDVSQIQALPQVGPGSNSKGREKDLTSVAALKARLRAKPGGSNQNQPGKTGS